MATDHDEKFSIRLYEADRPFLDDECLRMMQERFEQEGRLDRPSIADVVHELIEELEQRRRHAQRCPHQADEPDEADEAVDPGATASG